MIVVVSFFNFLAKLYLLDVSDGSEWNRARNCSCTDDKAFDSELIMLSENLKRKIHNFDVFM